MRGCPALHICISVWLSTDHVWPDHFRLSFTQEFYSVVESRYQRFVSPFSYEPRIDSVRASVVVGVLLGSLPKLLEFEAIRHLEALGI